VQTISTIIRNGTQAVFSYYNGDWPEDTVNNPLVPAERLLQTRLIGVTLLMAYDDSLSTEPIELTTAVAPRALKTNL
jgi:hypothetical protein